MREIRNRLKFMPYVPILFTSAKLGQGIEAVLSAAREIYQQQQQRLPPSALQEAMAQAVVTHAPPSIAGRKLKIRGVAQSDVNPPTFVFLVNDPKLLHFSYRRYLENSLRRSFALSGTPIRLVFKAKGEG
jgi:GTP-binding protein